MACRCCRSRKVRCDVADHGIPCCNCKLDKKECIIPERRKKQYDVNPLCHPLAPVSTHTRDWLSPLERPRASHLLQFGPNRQVDSQSQIDSLTQFLATRDVGHNGNWHLISQPAQKTSSQTSQDPELSRWLNMMPPRIVEKFRLHFKEVDESRRETEQTTWKPDPATLNKVQQAMDILQDVMTGFKSPHSSDELLSPPPDSVFQSMTENAMEKGAETDDSLSLDTPGFKIAASYPPSDISTTENDGDDWNDELMAELFCSHMGQDPMSGVVELKQYVDNQ